MTKPTPTLLPIHINLSESSNHRRIASPVVISLSQDIPVWWRKLPIEAKKKYLRKHPNSKLGKIIQAKQKAAAREGRTLTDADLELTAENVPRTGGDSSAPSPTSAPDTSGSLLPNNESLELSDNDTLPDPVDHPTPEDAGVISEEIRQPSTLSKTWSALKGWAKKSTLVSMGRVVRGTASQEDAEKAINGFVTLGKVLGTVLIGAGVTVLAGPGAAAHYMVSFLESTNQASGEALRRRDDYPSTDQEDDSDSLDDTEEPESSTDVGLEDEPEPDTTQPDAGSPPESEPASEEQPVDSESEPPDTNTPPVEDSNTPPVDDLTSATPVPTTDLGDVNTSPGTEPEAGSTEEPTEEVEAAPKKKKGKKKVSKKKVKKKAGKTSGKKKKRKSQSSYLDEPELNIALGLSLSADTNNLPLNKEELSAFMDKFASWLSKTAEENEEKEDEDFDDEE